MRTATKLLVAVSLVAVGCVAGGSQPAGLAEGLTVLDADQGTLSLAYRRDDVVIYMESLRGHARPDAYQNEANATQYEMDLRFADANGFVFMSQLGGDEWVDGSWPADLQRQDAHPPTAADNRVLFDLAGEAAATLRGDVTRQIGSAQAATLEPEIAIIHEFAEAAPATYRAQWSHVVEQRHVAPTLPGRGLEGEVTYGTGGPEDDQYTFGAANYYYIELHSAGISYTFGVGRHSATAQYSWSGNGWLLAHSNANHGNSAVSMGFSCLLQYYEAVADYHPAWTAGTCSTGYDYASGDGGHNCHDDSRRQMHNFVYGSSWARNAYWCNGQDDATDISTSLWPWSDNSGEPVCNGTTNTGYHHPAMCPQWNWGGQTCPDTYRGDGSCDCGCNFSDGTHADPDCHG